MGLVAALVTAAVVYGQPHPVALSVSPPVATVVVMTYLLLENQPSICLDVTARNPLALRNIASVSRLMYSAVRSADVSTVKMSVMKYACDDWQLLWRATPATTIMVLVATQMQDPPPTLLQVVVLVIAAAM